MLGSIGVIMLTERQVARVSAEIERLLQSGAFNNLQQIIIEQKYLSAQKAIDIRRLARSQHKPIKLIKREIEKADHKLYRLLKENLIDSDDENRDFSTSANYVYSVNTAPKSRPDIFPVTSKWHLSTESLIAFYQTM